MKDGKKESIQQPRFDYYNMGSDDDDEDIDLTEDELSHIVEIYDFPTDFKTEDLLKTFQCYQFVALDQQRGISLAWLCGATVFISPFLFFLEKEDLTSSGSTTRTLWVSSQVPLQVSVMPQHITGRWQQRGSADCHIACLLYSRPPAKEALRSKHPLLKLRPLCKSSSATKAKARSCSGATTITKVRSFITGIVLSHSPPVGFPLCCPDYLLPAKERPQTSAALARRLVTGALGVKSNVTKEQREAEKRQLQEAKGTFV